MYKKCIECEFHKIIPDPDFNDWFNSDDEAIVCTKVKKDPDTTSKYLVDKQPFKTIDVALRPYQTKHVDVPSWCPISTKELRDKKLNKILGV